MHRTATRRATQLGFVAVSAWASLAHAAEHAPPEGITLAHAIAKGAQQSLEVRHASRVREAARAFAQEPGSALPSPPHLTVLAGARNPNNMPLGPEVSVTLKQDFSFRGLGRARKEAASWTARAASSDVERARLEAALTAALDWTDLKEAETQLRLRTAALDDAAKIARITEVRVASGAATATDRSLASAEVGAAHLAILDAEGRGTEARINLAMATGTPLDRELTADGALETAAVAKAENIAHFVHPTLDVAKARAAQAEAEADVAHATQGPVFEVGATVWREGSRDHAGALFVTVPLPFVDPAHYDKARQHVQASGLVAHVDTVRIELDRELRLARHEQEHTREVRDQLRNGVVTPLRRALEAALNAYTAGMSDLTAVTVARRSLLAAEERLVGATADVLRADLRTAAQSGTLLRAEGGANH